MSSAAIFGIHQLAQSCDSLLGPSSAIPADAISNAVQKFRLMDLMELHLDAFGRVLSFLGPKDLASLESVSKTFSQVIHLTHQWKKQCQIQLGLSPETDPEEYLPEGPSYKRRLGLMFANILDESVYERHMGKVGPVPRIPEEISLKKWNAPDPCDPSKKIGREYVWMYCSSYIETNAKGFSLDKTEDPNDPEAPELIRRESVLGVNSENTALKVPVTINNIVKLFKFPKTGNSSTYSSIWKSIVEQHGNKRIPAGWICMRRDVIGRALSFNQQQALAKERGVVLSELLPRILFNFLTHVRSKEVNVYPDGLAPLTYARTSTLTRDSGDRVCSSACGGGDPFGLLVCNARPFGHGDVGVAVALPATV